MVHTDFPDQYLFLSHSRNTKLCNGKAHHCHHIRPHLELMCTLVLSIYEGCTHETHSGY
jgi:hypothetical protein